ncbi:MAG: EamA family transporter [Candidatus Heimdallarchaeota archaeon]|nr:EamA family transporter [Candidatus Heimdallarchaeota archaeon]
MRSEVFFPFISTSVWGISIVGGAILSKYNFTPIEITFGRFALASIMFIPVLIWGLRTRDNFYPCDKSVWISLFGLSITGVAVNNSIFYFGLTKTNASIASLLVSMNPLMTMLFGVLLLGEKMTKRKMISVISGIFGVMLIVGVSENRGTLLGNLIILTAVTMWGSSFSFSKRASNTGMSAIAITGWSEILGTLILLPVVLVNHSIPKYFILEMEVIFWFLFMGVGSSFIAYIIHYKAIEVFGAGKIAPSTNIIPFSGALTSWFLLGEQLDIIAILGFILIVFGVIFVHYDKEV